MDGIIVVNKPQNWTSRDIVNKVGRIIGTKKAGHTGTLDPMATGVLVLCVGKGTKVVEYLTEDQKIYEAEITLGYSSETEDLLSGDEVITEVRDVRPISNEEIDRVLESMIGKHKQMVPMYSAVKINGRRLLDYAHAGEVVADRPIKDIEIFKLERTSEVDCSNNKVKFKFLVEVSKGTFIRTLCVDIASRLGTIGAMSALNRVQTGVYNINDAHTLEDIEKGNYVLRNFKDALSFKEVEVDEFLYNKIRHGQRLEDRYNEDCITFVYNGEAVAVYKRNEDKVLKADKVF